MFKNMKFIALAGAAIITALAGCGKDDVDEAPTRLEGNDFAFVKFVHAGASFRTVVPSPGGGVVTKDSFNIYVSGQRVTTPIFSYGSSFPGQTTGYIGLTAGLHWFRLSMHGFKNIDSITLHSFSKVLEPGQKYSYIITDSLRSNVESRQMWLKDNFNTPVAGNYGFRFVHAVLNDTVGKTVDVYSFRRKTNLFTGVKIGEATGFVESGPNGNDTLSIRRTGTSFELARLNAIPFSSTRVYTAVYRGLNTTTGTRPRSVIYYLNN